MVGPVSACGWAATVCSDVIRVACRGRELPRFLRVMSRWGSCIIEFDLHVMMGDVLSSMRALRGPVVGMYLLVWGQRSLLKGGA